jgi:hypothetical protein
VAHAKAAQAMEQHIAPGYFYILYYIILYYILYYNFTTQRVAGSPQQYKNQLLWALFYNIYIFLCRQFDIILQLLLLEARNFRHGFWACPNFDAKNGGCAINYKIRRSVLKFERI